MTRELDAEARALFAKKGHEGGPGVPQAGEANAVKVRRVMQLTQDLGGRPFENLRILDLGCGEGVYAIEAVIRGAEVIAIDARTQRMDQGRACAERHGLDRVTFLQDDVRNATRAKYGTFDVVYLLGILYHLDAPDVFQFLRQVRELCTGLVIIDTLVSPDATEEVKFEGRSYAGRRHREHGDGDTPEVRRGRVLKSIDNTFSFHFTQDALVRALEESGFRSVLRCDAPREPGKADDRITLVARGDQGIRLAAYPWINDASEDAIAERLAGPPRPSELTGWIGRLFENPDLLRMGHNQRSEDGNLGLGWLYYALARIVRPRTAVVIGSWRGFVPLVLAKGLRDNLEDGELVFIDPSLVGDFWRDPQRVQEHFGRFGVRNVRHFLMTTQEFTETDAYRELGPVGLVFVDGYHSEEQARFDFEAFEGLLAPRGMILFHDSMIERRSVIYGEDRAYETRVKQFIDSLKNRANLQVLDVPFGTGLSIVRKLDGVPPLTEGVVGLPR